MEVILDTNFLALPFTEKVDIYQLLLESLDEPYELIVLEPCLAELEKINPLAVELAKKKARVVPAKGFADNVIIKYAKGKKALVCTQDHELRQKLVKLRVPVAMYSKGKLRRR
jgi:rRNA-processing protein FCF1